MLENIPADEVGWHGRAWRWSINLIQRIRICCWLTLPCIEPTPMRFMSVRAS